MTAIEELAAQKGVSTAQLALAWVLNQGPQAFAPIPGTKRVKYLQENLGALNVGFTPEELARIDQIAPVGVAAGERYAPRR